VPISGGGEKRRRVGKKSFSSPRHDRRTTESMGDSNQENERGGHVLSAVVMFEEVEPVGDDRQHESPDRRMMACASPIRLAPPMTAAATA